MMPYPHGRPRTNPLPPGAPSLATGHRLLYIVFLIIYHLTMASGTGPGTAAAEEVAPQMQQVNGLMDQGHGSQDQKGYRDRI
eukprot:9034466-Karenia_brevis.AAC.1